MDLTYLDKNLARVRGDLKRACEAGGYEPGRVTLMAAFKSADVEEINYLHTVLGVTHVGENRVQQLLERYDRLEREGLSIHFIGTLQFTRRIGGRRRDFRVGRKLLLPSKSFIKEDLPFS